MAAAESSHLAPSDAPPHLRTARTIALHSRRNFHSHQLQRGCELVPQVDDRRCAPPADVVALLVQDLRAVIERVERPGERERVLGEYRELERSNDLLDDLVEARRVEHERPELVAAVCAIELAGR